MAIGKKIETRGHIVGFREEIAKAAESTDNGFFTWFDHAKDKEDAFARGDWDFIHHIYRPCVKFITTPENKIALEIGHGGGRILAAACHSFKTVIGIDIHDNNAKVEDELRKRGITNFRLIKTGGLDIPLEDESVDFIYSFIVLQHVEKYKIFENYLKESYRLLKTNGIAVLYFGRKYWLSKNRGSRLLYQIERFAEHLLLLKGYQELPARVNSTNLIVSLVHAKALAQSLGFDVLCELVSRKHAPEGIILFGGQNGLVIRKR